MEAAEENLAKAEEIKAKAEDVYAKVTAEGADFDALMTEYSEDTGLAYYPDGYALGEGHSHYVEEFTNAALALENVGDISGIVETSYGYHILRYAADATSESDAMNEERDEIRQEMLQEPLKALIDAAKVTLNLDKLN